MTFTHIAFLLPGDEADRLSDALTEAGALSVEITDADAGTQAEQAAVDEPDQMRASWRRCRLSALFAAGADARRLLARACAAARVTLPPVIEETELADQDWVRPTRDQFRPIRISDRLWIVPSWESAPDRQAINLRLDPGLAFGTGSHPTTRLCLQWLTANLAPGASVLDYGFRNRDGFLNDQSTRPGQEQGQHPLTHAICYQADTVPVSPYTLAIIP